MIGSAISIRYVGKKPWILALSFWAVYLIIGLLFVTAIVSATSFWWLGILFSFAIFMALAIYWMKLNIMVSAIAFAVAYVLDFVIMYILASFGFSLSSLFGGIL